MRGALHGQGLVALWQGLFGTRLNAVISLACLGLVYSIAWPLVSWALLDAVWVGQVQDCRESAAGACWIYIGEKLRFFLFGYYPYEEQWRAALSLGLVALLPLASLLHAVRGRALLALAAAVGLLAWWLLVGGAGLPPVDSGKVGGLVLSLLLAAAALLLGFPLGLLLALGRSASSLLVRWPCVAVVELFRSSPMVNILIIASVVAPLLFPDGNESSKLVRVLAAFTIMAAAYIADALRGGLQAVHPSQLESATAVGMGYWQRTLLVAAPQAIVYAVPALANIALSFFKETALVTVVGMVDFLGSVQLAARDSAWLGFEVEGYVFAALVYFAICWVLTVIFRRIEAHFRFVG